MQDDLIIGLINNALGKPTPLDVETRGLLNLADILWQQSAGVFDISSGVLRNVWGFSAPIKVNDDCPFPSTKTIDDWMQYVGWDKVHLTENNITMHSDMQIDLGSIGKEYAADRCANIAKQQGYHHCLINLGGDVVCTGSRLNGKP